MLRLWGLLLAIIVCRSLAAAPVSWDQSNFAPPPVTVLTGADRPACIPAYMEAFTYQNIDRDGKPTQVFAILGMPPDVKPGEKVPAVILFHGGGGTAFYQWVALWNSRHYAAMAIDLCGNKPKNDQSDYNFAAGHLADGGPMGWDEAVRSAAASGPQNQWLYYSTAAVIRADSILRNRPGIGKVGVIGISWGGVNALLAAAADPRLDFAAAIYGCGFLNEDSLWLEQYGVNDPNWSNFVKNWDPALYVFAIKCPVLMVNSTNDRFFRFGSWRKTVELIGSGNVWQAAKVNMPHSYPPAGDPAETLAFADRVCKSDLLLPAVSLIRRDGEMLSADCQNIEIRRARLVYSGDPGSYLDRKYQVIPAAADGGKLSAAVPADAVEAYFTVYGPGNIMVTSPVIKLK